MLNAAASRFAILNVNIRRLLRRESASRADTDSTIEE